MRDKALKNPLKALRQSAENAARAWSGSNLGYHSTVYYIDLQPKPPEVQFSIEWGLEERWPVHVPDRYWQMMDKEAVIDQIVSQAGGHDLKLIDAQLEPIRQAFDNLKQSVVSILSVKLKSVSDPYLEKKLQEIEKLTAPEPAKIALRLLRKGQIMTRDTLALGQGWCVAPHQSVLALPLSASATEEAIDGLENAVRLCASHLQRQQDTIRDAQSEIEVADKDWYDVMQVCVNGHQITKYAESQPQTRQEFCDNCGAKTIDVCPGCENHIRGARHTVLVDIPLSVPRYCIKCGAAYPWQQASIDNLKEILRESELSKHDVAIIETALPDVLQETPKTESASLRVKRVLGKLGKPFYEISVKVITDIASETAKKTLGLPL
jgi:hypothetical protein